MSKPRAVAPLSRALLLAGLVSLSGCPIVRRDSILTQHNDSYRTGLYATERALTPAAVASRGMVLSYARPVDGRIAGQLLYVPSLRMRSGVFDAVFVTTTKNVIYAYDANERGGSGTEQGLLWKTALGPSHPTNPDWTGVLSTPVIDPDRNTMFVVYKTWDDGRPAHWLAALDIRDGKVLNTTRISARTTRSDGSALVFDSSTRASARGSCSAGA